MRFWGDTDAAGMAVYGLQATLSYALVLLPLTEG